MAKRFHDEQENLIPNPESDTNSTYGDKLYAFEPTQNDVLALMNDLRRPPAAVNDSENAQHSGSSTALQSMVTRQKASFNSILNKELSEDRRNGRFCLCSNCSVDNLATVREFFCCRETADANTESAANIQRKLTHPDGHSKIECITLHPSFDMLALQKEVLSVMDLLYSCGMRKLKTKNDAKKDNPSEADQNIHWRWVAYKSITLWIHGLLSAGDRRELPACVVQKIRMVFPSRVYRGFLPVNPDVDEDNQDSSYDEMSMNGED